VRLLQRVYEENFETGKAGVVEKLRAPPAGAVQNPHDPDAQWSYKSTMKDTDWVGHKVQAGETVEARALNPFHNIV